MVNTKMFQKRRKCENDIVRITACTSVQNMQSIRCYYKSKLRNMPESTRCAAQFPRDHRKMHLGYLPDTLES